jgi:lysophospholipase L1-like esterase
LGGKLKNNFNALWINNAGLDGHSTFGHLILIKDYLIKLKPKVVLLLVGQNDVGNDNLREFDVENFKTSLYFKSAKGFIKSLASYSEVISTGLNIYRSFLADYRGLSHKNVQLGAIPRLYIEISDEIETRIKMGHKINYLNAYQKRLQEIIKVATENNIKLVFLTQPALYGDTIDVVTGVDLGKIGITAGINGKVSWEVLELYNDVTRHVCSENNIPLIDLAREMPKNSKYYYDFLHYTNEGAEKVAQIVYENLVPFLQETYPQYSKVGIGH